MKPGTERAGSDPRTHTFRRDALDHIGRRAFRWAHGPVIFQYVADRKTRPAVERDLGSEAE